MELDKIEYDIDSVISLSEEDEKSMETKNLESPVSSEISNKTAPSIPSFPNINVDQELFSNRSQSLTIKKNWLFNKFFKDVEIYVKDASQDLPDADDENIISCDLQVPGIPNESDVLNNDVVPKKPNISNVPNKPNIPKKLNIPDKDDKSDKTNLSDEFDVANIAKIFEISDVPNVIRSAEKEIKEIDLSAISSELHYNRYSFDKNKQRKSINSDKTYIIENEFDLLKHSIENKNESNLNYGSLKKNSFESSETFLTPVNKRTEDVVEIMQTETFKTNNGKRTEELIHSFKRKIIYDKSRLELKIPKLNKENYNLVETTNNISNNKNSILNDLLHKYKETLVGKANEINDLYGQSIYMNNFDELQANLQNYFQNIVDIKKSMETNKKIIEDLRNKLHEKEDDRKKLIVNRDEEFEKILHILKEIDNYYEDNKRRFEMQYKNSMLEFKQSSIAIRNQIWKGYLNEVVQSFAESLGCHYTFDRES